MTEVRLNQKKLIYKYVKLLDSDKVPYIVKTLQYFYDKYVKLFNATSSVDYLYNQIGCFLNPYYNLSEENIDIFFKKRQLYLNKLSNSYSDKEYKSVSLDKLILELFSWTIPELKLFYKYNLDRKTQDKSKFNKRNNKPIKIKSMKGGGSSNEYMLYYIKSLSNIDKFKKTEEIFHIFKKLYINKINLFLLNKLYFQSEEIFIDKYTPFIDIEKLFLYLLNSDNKSLDNLINNLNHNFVKFDVNLKKDIFKKIEVNRINKKSVKDFNDKVWIYKANKYGDISFFKLFNKRLIEFMISVTKKKYIKLINITLYKTNKFDYNNSITYTYFSSFINNDINEIKKIDKQIILKGIDSFKNDIISHNF
jgi:hypothetical protein